MTLTDSLKYIRSRPKDELRAIYSTLYGVIPGVVPINDNDKISRPQLAEMILEVKGIRPRHLSTIHNRTTFAIRDYLRRQAKREGMDHLMNKPWKLTGLEYAVLFGHRIAKGVKAEVANDNDAPSVAGDEAVVEEAEVRSSEGAPSNDNEEREGSVPESDAPERSMA